MKFVDLVKSSSWLSVEIAFLQSYPDEQRNMPGYERVFNDLLLLTPIDSAITIIVKQIKDDFDGEEYVDVSGYYTDPAKSIDEISNSLALEFTPWEEWLGMDVDEQSLIGFSASELICHCLYEMTFISFDQEEVQNEMGRIRSEIDEVKNMPEVDKKRNLISFDEFLKNLKTKGRDT